jgi:hypothetical protein
MIAPATRHPIVPQALSRAESSRKAEWRCARATGTKANWCVLGVYFLNETPWASIAGISTLRVDGPIPCRDFNSDLETVAKSSSL